MVYATVNIPHHQIAVCAMTWGITLGAVTAPLTASHAGREELVVKDAHVDHASVDHASVDRVTDVMLEERPVKEKEHWSSDWS